VSILLGALNPWERGTRLTPESPRIYPGVSKSGLMRLIDLSTAVIQQNEVGVRILRIDGEVDSSPPGKATVPKRIRGNDR